MIKSNNNNNCDDKNYISLMFWEFCFPLFIEKKRMYFIKVGVNLCIGSNQ